MKKNILVLIVLLSFLLSQSEQPYPPINLVSIPTAGTMPKGYFSFENIFMNQGSIVPKFMIGITDNFMLGMSFGISHFIGSGDIEKFRSYPEVQIKYRLFDETENFCCCSVTSCYCLLCFGIFVGTLQCSCRQYV